MTVAVPINNMARTSTFRLWDTDGKFLAWLTKRQVNKLRIQRKIYEVYWNEILLGVQLTTRRPALKPTACSITANDSLINARITKPNGSPYPDEDLITLIQAKLNAWPAVFDKHAPII